MTIGDNMKKIILIGGGTFSPVVIDAISENEKYSDYEIKGILDDGGICRINYDYPLLGKVDDAEKFADGGKADTSTFVIAIDPDKHTNLI
jgi:hypothetical protein